MSSPHAVPRLCFAVLLAAVLLTLLPAPGRAAGTSVISGAAYEDTNRNGVKDAGELALVGQGIYLSDASGVTPLGSTSTDAAGNYRFSGLSDGQYRLDYDPEQWWARRAEWVPSTTGGALPRMTVSLAGTATADFGWRRIVRSTDAATPISTYTGQNGITVKSYDDVVGARTLYDTLMAGSLIGAEAPNVTVWFDYANDPNFTVASIDGGPGNYSNYRADVHLAYVSWLDDGDNMLFHEYGHAWSLFYAYTRQQDTSLASYLQARGILGDSRLGTSHAWGPRELIAEDYRQLFGTASARASAQENRDLPQAADVPGLRDFLATTYPQLTATAPPPPAPPPPPPPPPVPPPSPAIVVSALTMNPSPVKTTGTASFTLSVAASVTLTIRDAKGAVVRTLLSSASKPSGGVAVAWDRKNTAGQRVKAGTYTAVVDAADATGTHAAASRSFSVS